ncbi:DNA-processing protein DprA [Orbaceae bacterium ac157xtp]
MNKYEFFIRFSSISGHKSLNIKAIARQCGDDIDHVPLLEMANLDVDQIREFYHADISFIEHWLTEPNRTLIALGDELYPPLLQQISSPPLLLFILGNVNLLNTPQIAMVGSRNCSEYGMQWGRYFANELAINGLTITSGLALGIDAISHRGALDVAGHTIAVLGSGLNQIAPKTNFYLAKQIFESNGAVISEFLPNEKAHSTFYPRRNRIISGLSLGTFIVEASEKSGSLITAKYALEQNRDVFALPGDIMNPNSYGAHWLIKQGAYLVSNPNDILEHYSGTLSWVKKQKEVCESCHTPHPEVLSIMNNNPMPVDIIAQKTNLSISDLSVKLLELELEGLVKEVNGGYVRNQTKLV